MIAIRPALRIASHQDGGIILDLGRDQFFSMNPIGSQIWRGLEQGETPEQIIQTIASETGTEVGIVAADVAEFLLELSRLQLVQPPD